MLFHKFAESLGKREDLTLIGRFHLQVLVNDYIHDIKWGTFGLLTDMLYLCRGFLVPSGYIGITVFTNHDLLQVINMGVDQYQLSPKMGR